MRVLLSPGCFVQDVDESFSVTITDLIRHCGALRSIDRITDIADVQVALEYCQLPHTSLRPTDDLALAASIKLREVLFRTARHTDNTEYLNASIAVQHDALNLRGAHWRRFSIVER